MSLQTIILSLIANKAGIFITVWGWLVTAYHYAIVSFSAPVVWSLWWCIHMSFFSIWCGNINRWSRYAAKDLVGRDRTVCRNFNRTQSWLDIYFPIIEVKATSLEKYESVLKTHLFKIAFTWKWFLLFKLLIGFRKIICGISLYSTFQWLLLINLNYYNYWSVLKYSMHFVT